MSYGLFFDAIQRSPSTTPRMVLDSNIFIRAELEVSEDKAPPLPANKITTKVQ